MREEALLDRKIGRFELIKKLGEGAFGRVFLARDPNPRDPRFEQVAIKLPHPHVFQDMAMQMRFMRELQTVSMLREHDGVCRYLEQGMHQRTLFLVMEYVEGESLADYLRRQPSRPLHRALSLVRDIALHCAELHEQQVLHRDLKPSNIVLRQNSGLPVIMDFGLARGDRQQELRLTKTGQMLGTPYYMAPEVFSGQAAHATFAADIYSASVILFELLTGTRPFEGPTLQLFDQVRTHVAPVPSLRCPGLNPQLDNLCSRGLSKDPQNRFGGSMRTFADELQIVIDQCAGRDDKVGSSVSDVAADASTILQPANWLPSTRAEKKSNS